MGLSIQQLARLSELLDQSLPLSTEARGAWLEALPSEDLPLMRALRESLLSQAENDAAPGLLAELPTSTLVLRAGKRLGAYELLHPLGSGGMAQVWLARRADGVFDRQVALKIPRLDHVPVEMAERFARECRILATLEYPGVARLYDAGIEAGAIPYIAMEYVQGEPLIAWCNSHGMDSGSRVRLFLQILDAVGHAHALGIIHRDLKPSNILVTSQGDVRLLDFGVASLLRAQSNPRSLTQVYGRALTPEYASPELLRGEPVDVRSDIYSLGAVLHELLTGARPGQPGPGGSEAPALSGGLRVIVEKALAPAPADRYPDAATFAAALQGSIAGTALLRKPAMRHLLAGAAVILLVIAASLSIYRIRHAAGSKPPAAAVPNGPATTIAILPFIDLSERRDQGYLSDGLAVELIDLLTKIPELRVTARASSFAFRDRQVELATIARQLGVANVLEGSVRTSGNRLKFTVQLVRAGDGIAIWSETYDREMKDVFEIQQEVASAVVEALKLRLVSGTAISSEHRTANARAYGEYLLGRQYRDGISVDRQRLAQAAFERAVALDPSFAPARAGIALTAAQIGDMTMTTAPYDLALGEAERAMALAPHLPEAYVARANVRMHRNWDFVGARADLDFAANIDPNNMELLQAYGTYLWMTGKVRQALEFPRRNVARNPLSSTAWDWLGVMLLDARDYPAARKAFERAAELSPYSDYRALLKTLVELHSGNHAEALHLARQMPDSMLGDFAMALAAFAAGHAAEGRTARQRLIARAPDVAAAQIAVIFAAQGDGDQTFVWLDRAIAIRDPGLFSVQYHPELDKFKGDPRFERVLRLMNLAD